MVVAVLSASKQTNKLAKVQLVIRKERQFLERRTSFSMTATVSHIALGRRRQIIDVKFAAIDNLDGRLIGATVAAPTKTDRIGDLDSFLGGKRVAQPTGRISAATVIKGTRLGQLTADTRIDAIPRVRLYSDVVAIAVARISDRVRYLSPRLIDDVMIFARRVDKRFDDDRVAAFVAAVGYDALSRFDRYFCWMFFVDSLNVVLYVVDDFIEGLRSRASGEYFPVV